MKRTVNLRKSVLLAAAILIILGSSAMAQQSLRDIAKEYGSDWLVGRWTATTDDGTEIQLIYRWVLDGHAMMVDLKMGEYASHGMIYYVPGEEKATAISVDNRGGMSKGTWEAQDGKLISKSEHVYAGTTRKMAVIYSKVDAKTINVELYAVDQDDKLSDEPWGRLDFKRQARKKTGSSAGQKKSD